MAAPVAHFAAPVRLEVRRLKMNGKKTQRSLESIRVAPFSQGTIMNERLNVEPQDRLPASERKDSFLTERLLSLDVYRGLIMVTLAFSGFGLAQTATNHLREDPASEVWQFVRSQFEHVEWTGCGYWDLIQPSFMFMVGSAMAFSYAKRRRQGQTFLRMFGHALWRSIVLILLGIFLISNGRRETNWSLMNVLTQIGLGYTFLFLLWNCHFVLQFLAAAAILAGTWFLYTQYPDAGINLQSGNQKVGVSSAWAQKHLEGIPPAWHKNSNVGQRIDVELLNSLPRQTPFRYDAGGYQTINFLPSLATMLFGLMCGELLRSGGSPRTKLVLLFVAGLAGLAAGEALNRAGVCPLIKRIWTPSWALFSTGWCCLILGGLYALVDVLGYRRWAFPLTVVGVNSIAIYCMSMLLPSWAARTLQTHFGPDVFRQWRLPGTDLAITWGTYEPTVHAVAVGLMFWLFCCWMYRRKIFIRI
jgi:heparan-alpha-glucosaminide N-acetyltransferase